MKSTQLPLIEKGVYLTILSVNSVHQFSQIYLTSLHLLQINNIFFSKIALVGFQ